MSLGSILAAAVYPLVTFVSENGPSPSVLFAFLIAVFVIFLHRGNIQRLMDDICQPQVGMEYLSLAQNAERVADHLINVGKTIRKLL